MSPKRLSRVLKDLREAKGLSQVALAKAAKVERTYLVKLESGDNNAAGLSLQQLD